MFMKFSKPYQNTTSVELGRLLLKLPNLLQVKEQFPSRTIVHDEIKLRFTLKRKLELHYERIVNFLQYSSLSLGMLNLILLLQLLLLQLLHCIQLFSFLILDKIDLSITALPDDLQELEVIPISSATLLLVLLNHLLIVLFKHHNIVFFDFFL